MKKTPPLPPKKRAAKAIPATRTAVRPAATLPRALMRSLGKEPAATVKALLWLHEIVNTAMKATGATDVADFIAAGTLLIGALGHLPGPNEAIIALALDDTKPDYLLRKSSYEAVRNWYGTAALLLRQAAMESGESQSSIALQGTLTRAQQVFASAIRSKHMMKKPRATRTASTRGVRGVHNARIAVAYAEMIEAGERITPFTLARVAKLPGGFRQTKAWLQRQNRPLETPARDTPTVRPVEPLHAAAPVGTTRAPTETVTDATTPPSVATQLPDEPIYLQEDDDDELAALPTRKQNR